LKGGFILPRKKDELEKLKEEMLALEEKIKKHEEAKKELKKKQRQIKKEKEKREKEKARKLRTKRLIEIGALAEKYFDIQHGVEEAEVVFKQFADFVKKNKRFRPAEERQTEGISATTSQENSNLPTEKIPAE
jgi:hypothetical protein